MLGVLKCVEQNVVIVNGQKILVNNLVVRNIVKHCAVTDNAGDVRFNNARVFFGYKVVASTGSNGKNTAVILKILYRLDIYL